MIDGSRRHWHWPTGGIGHAAPNGARSTCIHCDRPIVFIEGYELRRSYWRAIRA